MNPSDSVSRRAALKTLGAGAAVLGLGAVANRGWSGQAAAPAAGAVGAGSATPQPFTLPKLDYGYDALAPHIDARTMEIHHSRHHQAYITNANNALAAHPALSSQSGEAILKNLAGVPEAIRTTLRNNVGGHVNHAFFWKTMSPRAGGAPQGELAAAIGKTFGTVDAFKAQFKDAAMKRFGSGWAWLVVKQGTLAVTSTANQDSPLSDGATPVLGVDVWEHAYYLHYQNRRDEYLTAFWNVVNWQQVAAHYAAAGRA